MEIFNNTTKVVKDDLEKTIQAGSRVSIAAACFSIYAYQELKAQLESCEELRFIFTSPTFIAEKTQKERREFYIPRLKREKSLYGTEFEVRLRNELRQKAVAKECAEWMRRKACFKSNTTRDGMNNFLVVDGSDDTYIYMPMNTFTTVDLGCERGNNIIFPARLLSLTMTIRIQISLAWVRRSVSIFVTWITFPGNGISTVTWITFSC